MLISFDNISSLSFCRENCYPPLTIYSGFLIAEPFKRFADGIPGGNKYE
jgi:hypothetical protein